MTFIQKDQCVSKINCSFFNPQTSRQFPTITIKPISCLQNHRTIQWRIHRCLENTVFTRGFLGKISEGHNCKLWRKLSVVNMYGVSGFALSTMENVIIIYWPIVLNIVLSKSSFKIALRFLSFHWFMIRIWDSMPGWPVAKPL